MRFIGPISLLALSVSASPLVGDTLYDFNTSGQLTTYFTSGQLGLITESTTGGLSNSGSLNLAPLGGTSTQIWTFNSSFSGTQSFTAGIYYYGDPTTFWQFGVVSDAAPDLSDGYAYSSGTYLPTYFISSGNSDGGTLGIETYDGTGSNDYTQEAVSDFVAGDAWYYYSINSTYLGGSQYELVVSMYESGSDGTLGTLLATMDTTITNTAIAGDDSVYLYFSTYTGQALDNFSTSVPEPSETAVFGGIAALGLVFARSRRRRA